MVCHCESIDFWYNSSKLNKYSIHWQFTFAPLSLTIRSAWPATHPFSHIHDLWIYWFLWFKSFRQVDHVDRYQVKVKAVVINNFHLWSKSYYFDLDLSLNLSQNSSPMTFRLPPREKTKIMCTLYTFPAENLTVWISTLEFIYIAYFATSLLCSRKYESSVKVIEKDTYAWNWFSEVWGNSMQVISSE